MNSLSWFLYFAAIINGLSATLIVSAVFISVICGVWWFLVAVENFKTRPPFWLHFLPVCLLLIGLLIPDKNTMYAIAASELGEAAVKSTIGTKVTKALEYWIDSQLPKQKEAQ